MSELGKLLKEKRLEQGISMEKLQEETKIRKRYIEAIEQGDYNILPGQFYARAFIKSYAEYIGLDPEQILEEYKNELPAIPTGPIEPVPSRKTKSIRPRSPKIGKWASRLLFYAFFLLLLFVVWLGAIKFFGGDGQTLDPDTNQGPAIDGSVEMGGDSNSVGGDKDNGKQNQSEEAPPDDKLETPEMEPAWTYVGTEGRKSTYRYENAEKMDITVRATKGDIWLEVTDAETGDRITGAGGVRVLDQQEETWELGEYSKVDFRFGNTASVELLVNGENVDLSDIPNRSSAINLIVEFEPAANER